MGYSTDFSGSFDLNKPLEHHHMAYLLAFSGTRRMKRDAAKTALLRDPKREAVGLPVGPYGAYFVGNESNYGQDRTGDVIDGNNPPDEQPGLWCQWVPDELGKSIQWDGGEKFYSYVEWLQYIVTHFLKPWGYVLEGEVEWRGQSDDDLGLIVVKDNVVSTKQGYVEYR
jgi:hypothetical protein